MTDKDCMNRPSPLFVPIPRKNTNMVRDMWWRGLPASIRGQVWKLSVANELNITSGNDVLCFFVHSCQ